jgi:MFS family permease
VTRTPLTAAAAERRLLLLSTTRWLPVGLTIGLNVLLMLERDLTLSQIGVVLAAQGFVVLALELPTGGLADAVGRRPVLVVAGVLSVVSMVLFLSATTFWAIALAWALQGVFRALDSGPLEAWYVDTAQADDPAVPVERALSRAATLVGLGIAIGALASGGLVAWAPLPGVSPLLLPFLLAIGCLVAHLVLTTVLVREVRPAAEGSRRRRLGRSLRQVPGTVRGGLRLLGSAPVLRALVLVEVFWSVGMIGFETLMPIRLAELAGGEERAGVIIGPVSAVAWGLFAAGAAVAGLASRWIGVAWTAILARVLNGVFVVVMGLTAGPVGLVTAYLATYLLHGAGGPMHNTLLHRQATSERRATVLSMNSMVAGGCYSLGLLVLGPLAEQTSTATAIVVAGAFSILGAVLYLPARRQERSIRAATIAVQSTEEVAYGVTHRS